MRKSVFLFFSSFLLLAFLFSCKNKENKDKEALHNAALTCYSYLIDGKCNEYVAEIAYSDSMPESYRLQMAELMAQYLHREKTEHGGIVAAKVLRDTVYEDLANVFIDLTYADSSHEELLLPMVRCNGEWKLQ